MRKYCLPSRVIWKEPGITPGVYLEVIKCDAILFVMDPYRVPCAPEKRKRRGSNNYSAIYLNI